MHVYTTHAAKIAARSIRRRGDQRRGAIAVLAAVLMMVMLGMVAFAVDMGYLAMARTEAQRTADATAHAAVMEFAKTGDINDASFAAQDVAADFTSQNPVLGDVAVVTNDVDVIVGRYEFGSGSSELHFDDPSTYNAIQVHIRRTEEQNGAVDLFFGSVFNHSEQDVQAQATAAIIRNVGGFRIPNSGQNVPMIPITLKEEYWERAQNGDSSSGDDDGDDDDDDDDDNGNGNGNGGGGNGNDGGNGGDNYSYDPDSQTVSEGSDGVEEIILFPNNTGSSGNLGTVNIGASNNSTKRLRNQIRDGLSKSDLDYHGGKLALNGSGELTLSGDPGLSASIQSELKAIVGQTRVIPLYRSVTGPGNNAQYKIVKFVTVRIMSANLSGNNKAIFVQPATLSYEGAIHTSTADASEGVFSGPRLVD